MRRIDTDQMTLVHYGREWEDALPPCKREMVVKLEQVILCFVCMPVCPQLITEMCVERGLCVLAAAAGRGCLRSDPSDEAAGRILQPQSEDDEGHMEACETQEGLCQCRASPDGRVQAPYPVGLTQREDSHTDSIQCG